MFEMCEHKQKFGLILVTAIVVLEYMTVPAEADGSVAEVVVDKLAAISDKVPNTIPWLDWNLNDMRPWRNALAAIIMQKRIYSRLKKFYQKKIQHNKKMQRKYRTIVPVSIVPSIIAAARFNRDRHSEYYLVGADDTVEPNKLKLPAQFNEISKDPVMENVLKYQHD